MIAVEWWCYDNKCNRIGRLMQVMTADNRSAVKYIGVVVTKKMPNDGGSWVLNGQNPKDYNILLPVRMDRLIVKGEVIPLM